MSLNTVYLVQMFFSTFQISEIQALNNNFKLKRLYLDYTKVNNLEILINFNNLEVLSVVGVEVNYIPSGFHSQNLSYLDISFTKIKNIAFAKKLKKLNYLNINNTSIKDLKPLMDNKELRRIFLDNTWVEILDALSHLRELNSISFSNTIIKDISPLKQLPELELIKCNNTPIDNFYFKNGWKELKEVDFSFTSITRLASLANLTNLTLFSAEGCKIVDCPTDVWETGDARQLRTFFQRKNKPIELNEIAKETVDLIDFKTIEQESEISEINRRDVKLILLGNSSSGKTSLKHFLETGDFLTNRESTHGLEIFRWYPDVERFPSLKGITVSVWDFGGQEYYHGAYKLFLSSNAIYVLLWDKVSDKNGRIPTLLNQKQGTVDLEHFEKHYWLETIRFYSGQDKETPLFVVQNKTDNLVTDKIRLSQQLHEDYQIQESFHISLKNGCMNEDVQHTRLLRYFSKELELLLAQKADEETVPDEWDKIRQQLLALNKKNRKENNFFTLRIRKNKLWITLKVFTRVCEKIIGRTLTEDEIYTIPRWLEKGGVIAFFPENKVLKNKIFINPKDLVEKIYGILDVSVLKKGGVFYKNQITEKYPDFANIFMEVAIQLELVFIHPDEKETECFIAPQYLPESHLIEDLFKIASHGAWENAFWLRVPLFFYKKLLNTLILFYLSDSKIEARHFWKHGTVFLKHGIRVIIKGLYPNEDEYDGKLLIGVEKTNSTRQESIQREIFYKCLEVILQDKELNNPTRVRLGTKKKIEFGWNDEIRRKISNELSENTKNRLKVLDVSRDGYNFIPYSTLLENANLGEAKINLGNGLAPFLTKSFKAILPNPPKAAKRIFLSYSHKNTHWLNRLRTHLAGLRRAKEIETWTDQEILPGELWDNVIKEQLYAADVFILLLSADFIASDYIWEVELPAIFEKFKQKKAIIIPVITEPHDLSGLPNVTQTKEGKNVKLGTFEIIPKDDNQYLKALSLWDNPEEGLAKVSAIIRQNIQK